MTNSLFFFILKIVWTAKLFIFCLSLRVKPNIFWSFDWITNFDSIDHFVKVITLDSLKSQREFKWITFKL
jgi:hypothetical protein